MGKIVSVCSGSGGVGKSTIAVLLAREAAKSGKNTVLLDASGIARSGDLMLGMESVVVLDMMDVVSRRTALENALYRVPGVPHLRFACASLYDGIGLGELSGVLLALRTMCDLVIVDLPCGASSVNAGVLDDHDAFVMVTRPDDASIRSLERLRQLMTVQSAACILAINRFDKALVKRGQQYEAAAVEMILDMPAACVIPEEECLTSRKSGQHMPQTDLRIRGEIKRLLSQVC